MILKEIDFSGIGTKRIRAIEYKKDGYTPCRHFYDAYPLDRVLGDGSCEGLYIALVRKAREDGGKDYSGGSYIVYNDLGGNIHAAYLGFCGRDPVETVREKVTGHLQYKGKDGFISFLRNIMDNGWAIKSTDLKILEMLGEGVLLDKCRAYKTEWMEKRMRENAEREEESRRERQERERWYKEVERIRLERAENKIRNRQAVDNEGGIILDLMRKHGVDVPLRTQGWILGCLVSVTFDGGKPNYTYRRHRNGRGSQRAFQCIEDLMEAIDSADGVSSVDPEEGAPAAEQDGNAGDGSHERQ